MTSEEFPVVCVWANAPLVDEPGGSPQFCMRLLERFGYRVKFLGLYRTLKTKTVEAGRPDVFFAIHKSDIAKFSVARFKIFSMETGFLYGIIYKSNKHDLQTQVNFFKNQGVPSFAIANEFERFTVFKIKLFDTLSNEAAAQQAIESFVNAAKEFEKAFPDCAPMKSLECGLLRWWEDIVDNGSADCYPPTVQSQFPTN